MNRVRIRTSLLNAVLFVALTTAHSTIFQAEGEQPGWSKFGFIKGRQAVSDKTYEMGWAMDGPIATGHGVSSNDGPSTEQRQIEYTFKANYQKLVARASAEIRAKGGVQTEGIGDHRWLLSRNVGVIISPGRFESSTGNELPEKGWVRVTLYHYYPVVVKRVVRTMGRLVRFVFH